MSWYCWYLFWQNHQLYSSPINNLPLITVLQKSVFAIFLYLSNREKNIKKLWLIWAFCFFNGHMSHAKKKNSDFPLNPGSFFVVVKSPHIPYTTRAFFFQWARHNWIWFPKNFLFEKFCPVTATRIPVPWHLITAGWFPTNRNDDILASTSHPGCHYLPPRMRRQMKVERLGFPNLKMSFQILVVTMQIASWVWVGGSSTCDIW